MVVPHFLHRLVYPCLLEILELSEFQRLVIDAQLPTYLQRLLINVGLRGVLEYQLEAPLPLRSTLPHCGSSVQV